MAKQTKEKPACAGCGRKIAGTQHIWADDPKRLPYHYNCLSKKILGVKKIGW